MQLDMDYLGFHNRPAWFNMSIGPKMVVAMVLYVPRIVTFFMDRLPISNNVDIVHYFVAYATFLLHL